MVLSFISSKVPSESSNTDIILRKEDSGFEKSGLKVNSVIKLDKIATVLKDLIVGELGELNQDIKSEINKKLIILFKL